MVELAPTGDGTYTRSFAGDTFNTAWYAKKQLPHSWQVAYCTCVGTDTASDNMVNFFNAAGIETDTIRKLPDRTVGLYMIELKDGERSFSYWRDNSAARQLAADPEWLNTAISGATAIHFSGITIAILSDDDRHEFLKAVAAARAAGAITVFDPNLRKRLWQSDAHMCRAVDEAARVAEIVLPSFDEEQEFFGDATPQDTIARYRAAGAGTIIVKNAAAEMVAWSQATGEVRAMPPKVAQAVDTTAAGDSFNAGALSALLIGKPLSEALVCGSTLAAKVVQGRGALVDVPD